MNQSPLTPLSRGGLFVAAFSAIVAAVLAAIPQPARSQDAQNTPPPYAKYRCTVCDRIYNEAEGDPASGIAAGTRWADVPSNWVCPDCGAAKADFEKVD